MKVLFVTRLFSGLESTAKSSKWTPTGVPTIYKIIERIANSPIQLTLIWTAKDIYSSWSEKNNLRLDIEGLNADVYVLSGGNKYPKFFGHKLRLIFRELKHIFFTLRMYRELKPDLIYIDNANIYVGALLARFTKTPVVFRVMGVYPSMKNVLSSNRLIHKLMFWCYSSPYRSVICTQDGSGVEQWLGAAISDTVPTHVLINGVDLIPKNANSNTFSGINSSKMVFLFVGKLTATKGVMEFLKGFIVLQENYPGKVHALIIGAGELSGELDQQVKINNIENDVTIMSYLPHSKIMEAYKISDVYVSLNRFGNLSVANLEAMKSGMCVVFPKSQLDSFVDLVTDELIPVDSAVRINSTDDIDDLTKALERLYLNSDQQKKYRAKMTKVASFIPSWEERIENEFNILNQLLEDL